MAKELSKYQQHLLDGFDKSKNVRFEYSICDCEHEDDVSCAEHEVMDMIGKFGGCIVDTYWDGCDCGEAYVTYEVPFEYAKDVMLIGGRNAYQV